MAKLSAAVIDTFRHKNNDHNADRFFATTSKIQNDLDPVAQTFVRRVLQIRRTVSKNTGDTARYKRLLQQYAEKHKKGEEWPKWYYHVRDEEQGETLQYPRGQPHPTTKEYERDW